MLTREERLAKLNLSIQEIEDILDLLALLARKHAIYFLLRPSLIDEKDHIFLEYAFASHSEYLITSNVKHFESTELKGFAFGIVTPGDFYRLWKSSYE